MPKAAAYRLTWLPEREIYELRESQSNQVLPVAPGSHAWFAWLAAVPSFTFNGHAGQLTVRQEARLRRGTYWYACRRIGEKMAKRYLGRTSELTPARLEEVAAQLSKAALHTGRGTFARAAAGAEMPTQHAMTSPSLHSPAQWQIGKPRLLPRIACTMCGWPPNSTCHACVHDSSIATT